MKYRVSSVSYINKKERHGTFKAKRGDDSLPCPLPPENRYRGEDINFNTLFELGELPSPSSVPRYSVFAKKLKRLIKRIGNTLTVTLLFIFKIISFPFRRIGRKNPRLAFYSGVLVSASLVTTLSATTVLLGLFGGFLAPYDTLTVPHLVGEALSVAEERAFIGYELLVSYKSSNDVPAGVIISQKPNGGVTRKLYKNGDVCSVSVTVSSGKEFYTVPALVGSDSRLTLLELKNNGIAVNTVYEYSSESPYGTVLLTSPREGVQLYQGDVLTVKISLGKKIEKVSVPDLYGLNESAARQLLESRGLTLGSISYRSSEMDTGKIISQKYSPYSSVNEGTAIDITVSLGTQVTEKTVPDLYGLDVDQAKKKLSEVGLVVGSIYSVSSGAPSGTVITQTPIAGTPITSALTSVDLYVSS